MNTTDQDLLRELQTLPGWDHLFADAPVPVLHAETVDRAIRAVRTAAVNETEPRRNVTDIATARRRKTRRWVAIAVAGVAVAAVVVVAPTVSTPGSAPVSVATAAEFLHHLAATATAAPGTDDAFWKVQFSGVNPMNPAPGSDVETTTTIWYPRTGGQWFQSDDGQIIHTAPGGPAEFSLGYDGTVAWTELPTMPSDPVALESFLRLRIGPQGSMVYAASQLRATAPLTAPQRAALFTIMSGQPGITMDKGVTDAAGRTGTAIVTQNGPRVTTSVILADDGTLLEILSVASQDHAKVLDSPRAVNPTKGWTAPTGTTHKGDVLSRQTYLSIGGTNTAPTQ